MNDENEVDGVCLVRLHSEFCDLRRCFGRRVSDVNKLFLNHCITGHT